jgi:hypothetical protein
MIMDTWKNKPDFKDSAMNVTGVLVSAGNVYTYFAKRPTFIRTSLKMHYKTELSDAKWKCFNM